MMDRRGRITQQKIEEFKSIFRIFDKDNDNFVNTKELSQLVKALNQTPTQPQIAKWTKIVDKEGKGKFSCEDFIDLMINQYKQPLGEYQLVDAMQSIFKPNGVDISMKEFRNIVTMFGQKLTDDELNQIFKELRMQKEESFNYKQFAKNILKR